MLMHFIASQSRQSRWQHGLHVTWTAANEAQEQRQKEPVRDHVQQLTIPRNRANQI